MKILYVSQQYGAPSILNDIGDVRIPGTDVPTAETLREADTIVIFGELPNFEFAEHLGGVINLVIGSGKLVIVLLHEELTEEWAALLSTCLPQIAMRSLSYPKRAISLHSAFNDYCTVYGRTSIFAFTEDEAVEGLAGLAEGLTAFCVTAGSGAFYLVTGRTTQPYEPIWESLMGAVLAHRSGYLDLDSMPNYLSDLRLPGEQDLLDEIGTREHDLQSVRARAAHLARFRLLIGPLSGSALEELAIEALNLVLERTSHSAQDREDVGAEDFWITSSDDDAALAEVKGIGSNVRREHVNQVDNHRAGLGKDVEELPGLLIVNTFRGNQDLEQRHLPINSDVIRHARRQNVLVLRTWDLYMILTLELGNHRPDPGDLLIDALKSGGGWLRVDEGDVHLIES